MQYPNSLSTSELTAASAQKAPPPRCEPVYYVEWKKAYGIPVTAGTRAQGQGREKDEAQENARHASTTEFKRRQHDGLTWLYSGFQIFKRFRFQTIACRYYMLHSSDRIMQSILVELLLQLQLQLQRALHGRRCRLRNVKG
jgi:hypothetical protein